MEIFELLKERFPDYEVTLNCDSLVIMKRDGVIYRIILYTTSKGKYCEIRYGVNKCRTTASHPLFSQCFPGVVKVITNTKEHMRLEMNAMKELMTQFLYAPGGPEYEKAKQNWEKMI
nr:hypothetical protein K-LCC10_0266 [Kaumoebavirus]